jgi:hypothetical protein
MSMGCFFLPPLQIGVPNPDFLQGDCAIPRGERERGCVRVRYPFRTVESRGSAKSTPAFTTGSSRRQPLSPGNRDFFCPKERLVVD